jgi:hypothetical protein
MIMMSRASIHLTPVPLATPARQSPGKTPAKQSERTPNLGIGCASGSKGGTPAKVAKIIATSLSCKAI